MISTRKGGGFYGYKVHAAVCTNTDLPVAWRTETASASEHEHMPSLLDTVIRRGFTPGTCVLDKGYDGSAMYAACESRDIRPIIPLKLTVNVANGDAQAAVVSARGVDVRRVRPQAGRVEVALPDRGMPARQRVGQGRPLHTLIPRTTDRWKALYRTRGAVERGFGRLKHEWGMLPLRVRRLPASGCMWT